MRQHAVNSAEQCAPKITPFRTFFFLCGDTLAMAVRFENTRAAPIRMASIDFSESRHRLPSQHFRKARCSAQLERRLVPMCKAMSSFAILARRISKAAESDTPVVSRRAAVAAPDSRLGAKCRPAVARGQSSRPLKLPWFEFGYKHKGTLAPAHHERELSSSDINDLSRTPMLLACPSFRI